jgi:DNA repair protein SbcC/Rad50
MAAIKKIVMKNVKGTTFEQELTGKDIIIGFNGVGKSTRIETLGTALLGYVPGGGRTPAETFKLSSGDTMTVGLVTDEFAFERTFERNEKTKRSTRAVEISYSESVSISPSKGEKTNTQKKARIEQEVGSFPVMLDFNQFLALSDTKRRDFIYSLSDGGHDWDKKKLHQYLREELLTVELEVNNPEYYHLLYATIENVIGEFPDHFNFTDGLNSILDKVTSELSHWKKKVKDSEGAVRSFAEMKNKMNETDRNAKQNKEELVALRDKLTEVKEQIARDEINKRNFENRQAKIERIKNEILQLENKTFDTTSFHDQINVAKEMIQEIPESRAAEYQEKAMQVKEENQKAVTLHFQAKGNIGKLEARGANIQQTVDTIKENKGVCIIQKNIGCNKDFTAYLDHAAKQIAGLNEQIAAEQKIMADTKQEMERLTALEREFNAQAQAENDHFRNVVNHNQAVEKQIQLYQSKITQIEQERSNFQNKMENLQTQLRDAENEPVEPIAPLDMLFVQRDGITKQIQELELKVEEQEKVKNQLVTLKTSMLENKKAGFQAEAFASIQKALGAKGVQGLIVKEMLDPIKSEIEENLKVMGIEHPVFFKTESDTGQEIFQFGWVDGQERNFDSLSTGQKMMYLIAFMTTVLNRANPPLKVLAIDNIENLDKKNLMNVLEGLNKISDKVDNILLSGVLDEVTAFGWNVINLGDGVHAVA